MDYRSNLTKEQWSILEPMLPKNEGRGRPLKRDMREVTNGINYLLKTGVQWRNLASNFPIYQTVYYHFNK
jgi:transposase